jgi:hypothetical protein
MRRRENGATFFILVQIQAGTPAVLLRSFG